MLKEKIRKRKWRANFRKDPVKHEKYKEDEKLKKRSAKKTKQANAQMTSFQPNGKNSSASNKSTPNSSSLFSCKQTLYRILQGLIYNCRKAQTKKLKLSKGLRQNKS